MSLDGEFETYLSIQSKAFEGVNSGRFRRSPAGGRIRSEPSIPTQWPLLYRGEGQG
jgi:hypothetical protein